MREREERLTREWAEREARDAEEREETGLVGEYRQGPLEGGREEEMGEEVVAGIRGRRLDE
jgi:hypothetical protein